jgi:hypothetical protein
VRNLTLSIDRCACDCGRFVDAPGRFATNFCVDNAEVRRQNKLKEINKEEPDVIY